MSLTAALRQQLQSVRSRPITSNILQLLFGSGVAQVFTALATLLVTRALSTADYGEYAATYAIAALTSTAFNLGMDNWLLQQGRVSKAEFDQFFGNSLLMRVLLGIPWLVALTIIAPLLNADTYPAPLVFMMGTSVWMDGLIGACHSYFKSKLLNSITALLLVLNTAGLFVWFLVLNWQSASVMAFTLARFGITAILLLITLGWLAYRKHVQWNRVQISPMLRASVPFALSELFYLIYMRADVTIIGIELNREAVGWYAPASYLISALFLVPSSLYMVMVPVLSKNIFDSQQATEAEKVVLRQRLDDLLKKMTVVTVLIGVALTVGTAIVGPILVNIVLPSYGPTQEILRILSLLLIFKTGSFTLAALLVAADLQRQRTYYQGIIAVLNATATWVAARWLGIQGVAWVYVFTEVVLWVGYLWMAWRWYHRHARKG